MTYHSSRVRLHISVTDYQKLVVVANLAGLPINQQANLMIGLGIEHTLRKWAKTLNETPEQVWRKRGPGPATENEE